MRVGVGVGVLMSTAAAATAAMEPAEPAPPPSPPTAALTSPAADAAHSGACADRDLAGPAAKQLRLDDGTSAGDGERFDAAAAGTAAAAMDTDCADTAAGAAVADERSAGGSDAAEGSAAREGGAPSSVAAETDIGACADTDAVPAAAADDDAAGAAAVAASTPAAAPAAAAAPDGEASELPALPKGVDPPRPRPPMWERDRRPAGAKATVRIVEFKRRQLETLNRFRALAEAGKWSKLHHDHFDWWMFPIDDGSRDVFNVRSEADVAALRADAEWHERYVEGVRLAARAWGWDLDAAQRIAAPAKGQKWTSWDVRLAKMIRSLWLFEETAAMRSLQRFAIALLWKEKARDQGFWYGSICLDEILAMRLPRRQ